MKELLYVHLYGRRRYFTDIIRYHLHQFLSIAHHFPHLRTQTVFKAIRLHRYNKHLLHLHMLQMFLSLFHLSKAEAFTTSRPLDSLTHLLVSLHKPYRYIVRLAKVSLCWKTHSHVLSVFVGFVPNVLTFSWEILLPSDHVHVVLLRWGPFGHFSLTFVDFLITSYIGKLCLEKGVTNWSIIDGVSTFARMASDSLRVSRALWEVT